MKLRGLIFGLSLMLAPSTAAAVEGPATSAYVNATLERASNGIAYAKEGSVVDSFAVYYLPWSQSIGSAILGFIDTELRIVAAGRDVPENTACVRVDLYLLEKKMEEVRRELQTALTAKKLTTIVRLQDLAQFLNERMEQVLKGSRDPAYNDTAWNGHYLFDRPAEAGWCCPEGVPGNACEEQTQSDCEGSGGIYRDTALQCTAYGCAATPEDLGNEKMCPFHSDYLPPSVTAGYGCDLSALDGILARVSDPSFTSVVQKEKEGTEAMATVFQDIITKATSFLTLQREIDSLLGRENVVTNIPPIPGHRTAEGCVPQPEQFWTQGAVEWELRGPFDFGRDETKILRAFSDLRIKQGGDRLPPVAFREAENKGALDSLFDDYAKTTFKSFSERQGQLEAEIFPIAVDPERAIGDALSLLVSSVGKLSALAHDQDGLRGFVRDYAYFLRRTCIDRPCNKRLDQILKIVFQDACFPYTNGEYLKDTPEDPRWEKCAEAAGIGG